MGAEEVLRLQAEELERKAKNRWIWYVVTIAALGVLALAMMTWLWPLMLAAGVFVLIGAVLAVGAENAGKKARLLRAQMA